MFHAHPHSGGAECEVQVVDGPQGEEGEEGVGRGVEVLGGREEEGENGFHMLHWLQ